MAYSIGAGGLLAKLAHGREFRLDLLKAGADGPHKALARFGGRDASRGAGQKPDAEARFELADSLTESRLRNAKLRCRLRKASFPPHCDKGGQVIQMSELHLSCLLIGLCGS